MSWNNALFGEFVDGIHHNNLEIKGKSDTNVHFILEALHGYLPRGTSKIQLKLLIHLYDLHTNFKYLIKCDNDSGAYLFPVPFTTSKTLAAWTLTIILSDPGCNCGLFTYLDHPRSFSVLMDMFFSSLFFLKPQTELSKLWSTHYLCWRSFMFHEKQFKPWWSTIPLKRKLSYVF
jgi:hypothetical protein